ncbi:MAG: penicillin-binding protein 2 [Gammaproteobacteria bacterium]
MEYAWRFFALALVLSLGMLGLVGRMLDLSVFNRSFLMKQSEARTLREENIPAYRGMITDRNGVPLAVSAPVDSIWVNPQIFHASPSQIAQLAQLLSLKPKDITTRADKDSDREFVYLARSLPPEIADQVKALKIPGIFFQREYRRFYPSGEMTAHVLGFTNIDDNGQEGLELAYNDWLRGVPGKMQVIKDRLGHTVDNLGTLRAPQQGKDLVLSLDSRIQYLAYTTLQNAAPKFHADSGSIIVLNVKTGEILAMANVPSYNPNAKLGHDEKYRNRAVTDLFEPGSTLKTFSIASALASGRFTPTTIMDTRPGWMNVNGHIIRDDANFGVITVTQVLQHSSNIGAAKMTLALPPLNLWSFLTSVGFGQSTQSGFPGEAAGVLIKDRFRSSTDVATMAYGYGLSTTALQLVQAYGIIAANGVKRPLTFLKTDKPRSEQQVLSPALTQEMLGLLKTVTEPGGSGTQARIAGYQIGGKTGTAYMAKSGGYEKNRYNSSFIGIAPLSNPQLIVAVVLHGVQGNIHFGGQVSAPVFAVVMGGALRYLNIPPDDLTQNS